MNQHLAVVVRYWDILPWHLKAKIILLCEFYYLRHRIRALFSSEYAR
jgi:hypothetical protein